MRRHADYGDSKDRSRVQRLIFLAFFGFLFLAVLRLVKPFFTVILWSSLVYGFTEPLYRMATTTRGGKPRRKWHRAVAAAVFSVGSLVLIVVPIILLFLAFAGQLKELFEISAGFLDQGTKLLHGTTFSALADSLAELSGGIVDLRTVDLGKQAESILAASSERLVSLTTSVIADLARFVAALAFFAFFLFFLYLDGKELLTLTIGSIPLRNAYTIGFLRKFRDTGKELVIGYLLMGLFQGLMAFLVYFFMKVPAPVPLAILSGVSSLIPFVGAGLVWVPVVIARFASEGLVAALFLLALCAFFISTLDNFIRPFVLHSRIKLHPLLIFMAIIGGLGLFGFNGLILGPILLVLFFSAAELFSRAYGRESGASDDDTGHDVA